MVKKQRAGSEMNNYHFCVFRLFLHDETLSYDWPNVCRDPVSVLIIHLCNIWAKELAKIPSGRIYLVQWDKRWTFKGQEAQCDTWQQQSRWLWSTYRRRDECGWLGKTPQCSITCARGWSLHVSVASVSPLPSNWSQCEFGHRWIYMTRVWMWCWSQPIWLCMSTWALPRRPGALISAIRARRCGRSCSSSSMALKCTPYAKWWRAQLIRDESGGAGGWGGGGLVCWLHEEEMKKSN